MIFDKFHFYVASLGYAHAEPEVPISLYFTNSTFWNGVT